MPDLIRLEQVTVRYDNRSALDRVSWRMPVGTHYAILGANGSGKSTLIKVLSRDIYPLVCPGLVTEQFGATDWNIWQLKQYMGFITHDLHVQLSQQAPLVRGFEAIISSFYSAYGAFAHHQYSEWQKQQTWQVMQQLAIEHLADQPIGTMSTGELRRCVIARALIHQPRLLLLDEPTIGLDIKAQRDFLQVIRSLTDKVAMIMVTHHVDEIIPEISHVAMMKQGKILLDGVKQSVLTADNLTKVFDFPVGLVEQQGWYRLLPASDH